MPTNQETWTGTKRSFIASMSQSMPNEIVEAGKARGLKLTLAHVYAVRSLERRLKKQTKHSTKKAKVTPSANPRPAARSRRARRARTSGLPSETSHRKSNTRRRKGPGRRGQRGEDFGGLMLGLVAIGGHHFAQEIVARLQAGILDDATIEGVLKACGALLGLPRSIALLSEERKRVEQSVLGALR